MATHVIRCDHARRPAAIKQETDGLAQETSYLALKKLITLAKELKELKPVNIR